jgi:hypothetical protein
MVQRIQPQFNTFINFTGKKPEPKARPLAIMCDVYDHKGPQNTEQLVTVKDWQKTRNHGFLTTAVAHASAP